jgi:hypothetical protein
VLPTPLTPTSPIAHDFAVLPKSLHTIPATSISQELDEPKSVHTIRYARRRHRLHRRRSPLRPPRLPRQLALPPRQPSNPSTSARAMAAIASTSCADIMACGNASIEGRSDDQKMPCAVLCNRR